MSKSKTIYQSARELRGITQEKAAELICVSVESLRAYETGRRVPAGDIVTKMAEAYGSSLLAYRHLINSDAIANRYLPEVKGKTLPESSLGILKEVADINELLPLLVNITCDGEIDGTELESWEVIKKELLDIVRAYYCLILSVDDIRTRSE